MSYFIVQIKDCKLLIKVYCFYCDLESEGYRYEVYVCQFQLLDKIIIVGFININNMLVAVFKTIVTVHRF